MRAKLNLVLASVIGGILMLSCASSQEIYPLAVFSGQAEYSGMPLEIERSSEVYYENMWNSALSRGHVFRTKDELDDFVASFPEWTCSDCPPQALSRADIDFSSTVLVVVVRNDMYVPPRIRKVLWGKEEIKVYFDLPPLGNTVGYARASDVSTYSAAVVPRTDRPIVFVEEEWTGE